MKQKELTEQQKRFCEEFVKDRSGTQAAVRAGYSPKTAASQATRLFKNAKVQTYIQELRQGLKDARIASAKDVLITFTNILMDSAAKPQDRLKAGELLSRHMGPAFQQELEDEILLPFSSVETSKDLLRQYEDLHERIRLGKVSDSQVDKELAVLSGMKSVFETVDLEARIEALEQLAEAQEEDQWDG